MARALVVHERTPDGGWRPVTVFLGVPNRLMGRTLPGSASRSAGLAYILANAVRPNLDESGVTNQPGSWEDWIGGARNTLANGHDSWATEVDPELTIEALYKREVVGGSVTIATPDNIKPTDLVPDLGGYKTVRPR